MVRRRLSKQAAEGTQKIDGMLKRRSIAEVWASLGAQAPAQSQDRRAAIGNQGLGGGGAADGDGATLRMAGRVSRIWSGANSRVSRDHWPTCRPRASRRILEDVQRAARPRGLFRRDRCWGVSH